MEGVARHDLEQVAAGEPFPGGSDDARVRTRFRISRKIRILNGAVVAGRLPPRGARCGPRQARRRGAAHLEVVGVAQRGLALAVQHVELVGQVQDQVALPAVALAGEPDRLELERQVIAERAVQAKMLIGAGEGGNDLPNRGEDRGLAAAFLLGEGAGRSGDDHLGGGQGQRGRRSVAGGPAAGRRAARAAQRRGARSCGAAGRGVARAAQRRADHREQDAAAFVQRPCRDPPAAGDDLDARVHVRHVPAAVAARVLHSGAEHAAAAPVDLPGKIGQQRRIERGRDPPDRDSGRGNEAARRCGRRRARRARHRRRAAVRRVRLCLSHGALALSGPAPAGRTRERRPPGCRAVAVRIAQNANQAPPNGGATSCRNGSVACREPSGTAPRRATPRSGPPSAGEVRPARTPPSPRC